MKKSTLNLELLLAERTNIKKELVRSRILTLVGGGLYLGWIVIHRIVSPEVVDSVMERLWLFIVIVSIVAYSYFGKSSDQFKLNFLKTTRWMLVTHYFSVVARNDIAVQYAMCAFFLVFILTSLFQTRRSFLFFSLYVVALSLMCGNGQEAFPGYAFQFGIATSLLISYMGLANRMDLVASLSASESLFRSLFQNTSVGMVMADLSGELAISNQIFEKSLGRSSKDLAGQKIENWIIESERSEFSRRFKEFVESESASMTFENQFTNLNLETIWLRASASKIKTSRNSNFIFLIFENISQQKAAESTVASQQEKLHYNSKMTALGEMAGGVAHEINTPLTAILLLAESLEMIEQKDLTTELVNVTTTKIINTVNRISKIIQGLRKFSRSAVYEPKSLANMNEIVQDTLGLCEESFRNDNIKISVTNRLKDLHIYCRQVEISQVLLNLLNNSKDAIAKMPDKWIKIDISEQADHVFIEVTDCGQPIPIEIQNKIFQPFFTTKPVGVGTGLGLSISVGIIHAHGGTLEYDNISQNCKFVIKLPKDKTKLPPAGEGHSSKAAG